MNRATTPDVLLELSTSELLHLFMTLEAPELTEMEGEYAARLLAQPGRHAALTGYLTVSSPLQSWLCKAFRPVDTTSGRGYNTFRQGGRIVQRYPMQTLIAPSRYDGRPAFQLVYRAFHSFCGTINMVDEVRRVVPGIYLGIGTYGFTRAQRWIPYPFLLEGPQADYRGDTGRPRTGFKPTTREMPAFNTRTQ
ncbi:MAG: hypothetical protein R3296_00585 [Oleiphilaceae bacterium]|nr:hypothetical protein [Oleiphilaceae bacterium]